MEGRGLFVGEWWVDYYLTPEPEADVGEKGRGREDDEGSGPAFLIKQARYDRKGDT